MKRKKKEKKAPKDVYKTAPLVRLRAGEQAEVHIKSALGGDTTMTIHGPGCIAAVKKEKK